VVVADSSKLGRRGFAKIGDLGLVSDLITDSAASPDAVEALRRGGIQVHLIDAF
jgi:DeoR/GlpR family transcriptional regulator of sugar metabolism